jgi:hypothetical protein
MPNLGIAPEDNPLTIESYQRTLFVDVDDTCLDVLGGLVQWLAQMNRLKQVTGKPITDREHIGDWLGIDEGLAQLWVKEFTNHTWQWGALRAVKDSNRALQALKKQGWKIVALAHSGNDLHRAVLRRANLELLFPGVFSDLFAMPLAASFYPYMKDIDDAVCITASIRTAKDTADAGHVAYMLDQPWNRDFQNLAVKRFANWIDIANTLMKSPARILIN